MPERIYDIRQVYTKARLFAGTIWRAPIIKILTKKLIRDAQSPSELIRDFMKIFRYCIKIASKPRYERAFLVRRDFGIKDRRFPRRGNDKTLYVIGLFGSGRWYLNQLILHHAGRRAKYFRDTIRCHPNPTSMIYSGHATMKYVSRHQAPPTVTSGILQAVESRSADVIFIYRHPLDSLLTNWIWWRDYILDGREIGGISTKYKGTDDMCVDLEKYFSEFETFAEGDPAFFPASNDPPFLSFPQFVEETELFIQSATLSLRMEDFAIDPPKEFLRLLRVMSPDFDSRGLHVAPPRSKMFRFLEVKERVPQFRDFVARLGAETKGRIEKMGYVL
jgi:hypothetical protein